MRALVIHGAERMELEEHPVPEPGPGQVRLRVRYVGICGSDLHYYYEGANGEFAVREPFVPGHELSAVVELDPTGELAPGTPVVVHPARYGPPLPGLEDRPHIAPGGDYLGSAAVLPHRQGAAVEQLVVGRSMLRVVPADLPLQRAALAEPLAVSMHAVALAGDLTGARVLVLGAGPIGLLAVAALRARGVEDIVVGDVRPEPLQRAEALGASATLLVGETPPEPAAFDVVFECSSVPASLTSAIRAVAPAGTVVQVGILPDREIPVNLAPMLAKEATLLGSWRFHSEIDDAVALLAAEPALDAVVTQVIDVAEAERAFRVARDATASAKVLVAL